jgi:hypothetical protein
MSRQRSNTSSRLRNDIEVVFSTHLNVLDPERFEDVSDVLDGRAGSADLIGGKKNAAQKITYHPFAAPVLHSDGSTAHNPEMFLHSKLIMHVSSVQKSEVNLKPVLALYSGCCCNHIWKAEGTCARYRERIWLHQCDGYWLFSTIILHELSRFEAQPR